MNPGSITRSARWDIRIGVLVFLWIQHGAVCDTGSDTSTCLDWRLPIPSRGSRTCDDEMGTMRCNVTCNHGYYFKGGHSSDHHVEYICEGGHWEPDPANVPACVRVDYCENVTCSHGGMCMEGFHDWQCICKAGYTGPVCETDIDECASHPCHHGGTCLDDVSGFRCRCDVSRYVGVTCQREKVRRPLVETLSPDYGPVAGGTVITLEGRDFIEPVEAVYIGESGDPATVTYSDRHKIIARTPAWNGTAMGNMSSVRVVYAGGLPILAGVHYQYRNNPSIESVHPLATVVEGGTTLTVNGTSLNCVYAPWLEVTMVYTRRMGVSGTMQQQVTRRVFSSPCTVITDTEIRCTTPPLAIPPEFKFILMSSEPPNMADPDRNKRRAEDTLLNFSTQEADLEFFLGFMFDGYRNYTNLTEHETMREFARLDVHRTPKMRLYDPTDVIPFEKDKPLAIVGENMNTDLFMTDYQVQVGMESCQDLKQDGSMLSCMPPQSKPEKRRDNIASNPMIMVKFGSNVEYTYAQMEYAGTSSNGLWIGLGSALAFLVVAAVILGVVVWCQKKKRKDTEQNRFQNRPLPDPQVPRVVIKDKVNNGYTSSPDESYEKPMTPLGARSGIPSGYYQTRRTEVPFGHTGYIGGVRSPTAYDKSGDVRPKHGRFQKNKSKLRQNAHLRLNKQRLDSSKIPPKYPLEANPRHQYNDSTSSDISYLSLNGDSDTDAYVKLAELIDDENFYVDVQEALLQARKSANPRKEFHAYMSRMASRLSRRSPNRYRAGTMYPTGFGGGQDNSEDTTGRPSQKRVPSHANDQDINAFGDPVYNTSGSLAQTQSQTNQDPMFLGDPIYNSNSTYQPAIRNRQSQSFTKAGHHLGASTGFRNTGRANVNGGTVVDVTSDLDDSDDAKIEDNPYYVGRQMSTLERPRDQTGAGPSREVPVSHSNQPPISTNPDDWPVYRDSD